MSAFFEHGSVGAPDGGAHGGVADEAAVDEGVHVSRRALVVTGFGEKTAGGDAVDVGEVGGGVEVVVHVASHDAEDAVFDVFYFGEVEDDFSVFFEADVDVGAGQSDADEGFEDVSAFGAGVFEEFEARGGIKKQVLDGDDGTRGHAGGLDAGEFAAFEGDAGAFDFAVAFGANFHARHGPDGGHGFAAKSEGADSEEVVDAGEFAGGVAFEGAQGVFAAHTAAVVFDADELASAVFDGDVESGGAGVECVFDEFFDDGGRAFDDFTGRDLVGELGGEHGDGAWRAVGVLDGDVSKRLSHGGVHYVTFV